MAGKDVVIIIGLESFVCFVCFVLYFFLHSLLVVILLTFYLLPNAVPVGVCNICVGN